MGMGMGMGMARGSSQISACNKYQRTTLKKETKKIPPSWTWT
jgi:hypothetical protein